MSQIDWHQNCNKTESIARAKISSTIELEYDTFGDPKDPALLLIMGYGAQLVVWEEEFCQMFAAKNLFVIRYDNRDCGLSTKFDGIEVDAAAVLMAALMKEPIPPTPYTLADMAKDAVGLLDFLKIERAHIFGASMGGMIAQTMALDHPTRVQTLISVMSGSELESALPTPEAMAILLSVPPSDREGFIAHSPIYQEFQSKKYRSDENSKRIAARDFDRSYYPQGVTRQFAAIFALAPRLSEISNITTPTLVIHGKDDTLIRPVAGQRTAEIISNAKLVLIDDMGHDMPKPIWRLLVDLACDFIAKHK